MIASRPWIFVDNELYLGKHNVFHCDLADECKITEQWLSEESHWGLVYEDVSGNLYSIEWYTTPLDVRRDITDNLVMKYKTKGYAVMV